MVKNSKKRYYISWKENSLFEPCSSLFEDLCSNGCSKQLVRILVRYPCSNPCSRINPKMPGPRTMLVRGLVRRLFVACTSTFHLRPPGPLRPCAALYEVVVRSLAKSLVQGVVRSAFEQPLNNPIPLRR